MNHPIKKQDKSIYQAALNDIRLAGYTSSAGNSCRDYIRRILSDLEIQGAHLDHEALSIFKALGANPVALSDALSLCPIERIDCPLLSAAIDAGAKEDIKDLSISVIKMTPLQICARFDLWRETRLLLSYGADPSFFNASVTATGMAAYCGSARSFAEIASFGADLRLYLLPEHVPHSTSAAGSTLLHRMANRISPSEGQPGQIAITRILARDEKSYPDLLCKTLSGETVLDWAADQVDNHVFKSIILKAISDREAKILTPLIIEKLPTEAALRI